MSDFTRTDSERVSRERAAERLIDLAYALTLGGPLEIIFEGERLTVPLGAEVRLDRDLTTTGDRVELELELSWSSPDT